MSALQGIRVVELASECCAFAGKLMGDMGADVILVEPLGGSPARSYPPFIEDAEEIEAEAGSDRSLYWYHYNTSKRSVVLDLDGAAGQSAFRKLIATADVLIESEAPGRLVSIGLDYAGLTPDRPDLIHASITPFGRETSRRDESATDLTILAGGGPVWSCGYDDHSLPPIRGRGNQGYQTACHYAVMSALTAILYRGVSGEGQFIDVSMHAAANVTTEIGSYGWLVEEQAVQRQTGRHASPTPSMPVQIVCADGRSTTTGMPPRSPAGFGILYDWLDSLGLVPELPEAFFLDGARNRSSVPLAEIGVDDEVTAIYSAAREALVLIAKNLSAHAFFEGAQSRNITVGTINSPEEAYEDPHFVERGFQVQVDHPELGKRLRYPGAPYRFSGTPWSISKRAPLLGEHDRELFDELGLGPEIRSQLR